MNVKHRNLNWPIKCMLYHYINGYIWWSRLVSSVACFMGWATWNGLCMQEEEWSSKCSIQSMYSTQWVHVTLLLAPSTHHSSGNLVCKWDKINWFHLSQRSVGIFRGILTIQKRTVSGWSCWGKRHAAVCMGGVGIGCVSLMEQNRRGCTCSSAL